MFTALLSRQFSKTAGLAAASLALVTLSFSPAQALWNGRPQAYKPSTSFTVLLKIGGDKQLDCSGVLIAPRLVLTAGHCLASARAVKVIAQTKSGIEAIVAEDWIVHPSWNAGLPLDGWDAKINARNGDRYIDLAVLRLAKDTSSAHAISLSGGDFGGLKTYGYARGALLEPLHYVDASSAKYTSRLSPRGPLKVYASGGSAWCQGDSGGPVTASGADGESLVGIVGLGLGAIDYDPASALSMRWGGKQRVPKCGAYAYVQDVAMHAAWIGQASDRLNMDAEATTASLPARD